MSVQLFLRLIGVFVILVVIAAILFPVFAKVRGGSHHGNCASNMKQLGLALAQYVQDNDETMPNISDTSGNNTWRTAIYPYVKSMGVYQCPAREISDHDANPIGVDGYAESYAANYSGNNGRTHPDQGRGAFAGPGSMPIALTDAPTPGHLIVLVEAAYNPFPQFNIDDARSFGPASRRLWAGHSGLGNYLFLDGHVKSLHPQDTDQVANVQSIHNFWYRNETQPLSANGVAVLQDAQQRFAP